MHQNNLYCIFFLFEEISGNWKQVMLRITSKKEILDKIYDDYEFAKNSIIEMTDF